MAQFAAIRYHSSRSGILVVIWSSSKFARPLLFLSSSQTASKEMSIEKCMAFCVRHEYGWLTCLLNCAKKVWPRRYFQSLFPQYLMKAILAFTNLGIQVVIIPSSRWLRFSHNRLLPTLVIKMRILCQKKTMTRLFNSDIVRLEHLIPFQLEVSYD